MSSSHSDVSLSHAEKQTTTVYPTDKIEHAGSMSQEENTSVANGPAAATVAPPPRPAYEELMWPKFREWGQDFFSEFAGTMVLILFGDGVVAQVVLSSEEKGNYQSISWGWG